MINETERLRPVDLLDRTKPLDGGTLEKLRNQMLNRQDLYEAKRAELQQTISEGSRFLNFNVNLVSEGDLKRAVVTPARVRLPALIPRALPRCRTWSMDITGSSRHSSRVCSRNCTVVRRSHASRRAGRLRPRTGST